MIVGIGIAVALVALALGAAVKAVRAAGGVGRERGPRPFRHTGRHYRGLYSRRGFLRLGAASAGAFVLAHVGVDAAVERWHAGSVRGPRSDLIAEGFKGFGERFWFAVWGVFALLDGLLASSPLLRWGRRNFEAMVVGLPALWTIQRVGGAGRPTDKHEDPKWRPMSDDNTASGHTFIAAIPWLNAGREIDTAWLRRGAWVMSWGTGWSRMNDRRHYLSQVLLGHRIAGEAVDVVGRGDD